MKKNEPTLEMMRIRELRRASQNLISMLIKDGWIDADANSVAELEAAWLSIWDDYTRVYSEREGEIKAQALFGNPKFTMGKVYERMAYKDLEVGDCVENPSGEKYTVVKIY